MALTTGMIHGLVMMASFGWLLPLGALTARFLKHWPHWFPWHFGFQLAGTLLGMIGFGIAVANFDVLGDPVGSTSYQHGCLGAAVMALVLLQGLVAVCRPAPSQVEEDHDNDPSSSAIPTKTQSGARWWWELQHKGLGYLLLLLIFVTIWLGTSMEGTTWQLAYLFGCMGSLVLIAAFLWWNQFRHSQSPTTPTALDVGGTELSPLS
jgi:hypothetical protein